MRFSIPLFVKRPVHKHIMQTWGLRNRPETTSLITIRLLPVGYVALIHPTREREWRAGR